MTSQALVESDNGQHAADRPADGIGVDSTCGNSECIGESSPVETFSLLANEDRLAILGAVVRAHERGTAPVPFSTLRETVGIRDSGRFSYHLQELTGPLLTRSPDGYSLREGCRTFLVRILASVDVE